MLIKCVQVELSYKYEIELATNGWVYGVETGGNIFAQILGKSNIEMVGLLCMNHINYILNYSIIAIGKSESVEVPISQILKTALLSNADKIMIAHNHPSGILNITLDDINLTRKIGRAAELFKIQLIDSLVVNANGNFVSIREKFGENIYLNEGPNIQDKRLCRSFPVR